MYVIKHWKVFYRAKKTDQISLFEYYVFWDKYILNYGNFFSFTKDREDHGSYIPHTSPCQETYQEIEIFDVT